MTADTLQRAYVAADTTRPLDDRTVNAVLADQARAHPDRVAMIGSRHGDGATVQLTYSEYLAEAQHVASALARYAQPGDRVALWAPNVAEWPVILQGAAIAGVVLVALNPVLRLPELQYAVQHSGAVVLLHADRSRDYDMAAVIGQLRPLMPELLTISLSDRARWRAVDVDPDVLAAAPVDAGLAVMLQYTSGTTGNPKGVLLNHRALVNVSRLTWENAGAEDGSVFVNALPVFHTASCVVGVIGSLTTAGTHILIEQFVPATVLDALRPERPTILLYVPAVLSALLDAQAASALPPPHVDIVLGGAAAVPSALIEAAETTFGGVVLNVFGQTELAPVLTGTRPGDARVDQLTTVGHPLPHVEVKIVDPVDGRTVPLDVVGEICARGYQQLIEYQGDPEATARTVDAAGWVHTGDLGSMDARGYLTVAGRLKDIIIRKGENIGPGEVENCLSTHPGVRDVSVVGVPHPAMGEEVVAVVRPRAGADAAGDGHGPAGLRDSLVAFAREHLSPHKVPSRWFVISEIPVTPTGKIRKFQLVDAVVQGELQELQ